MKLFYLMFATAAAITATISNLAFNTERYKMRPKRGNIQRAWQRQRGCADQPMLSVADFATAIANLPAKLEQRRHAMATFERMMATVAKYRS